MFTVFHRSRVHSICVLTLSVTPAFVSLSVLNVLVTVKPSIPLVFIAVHAFLPSKCIILFDNVCVDVTSTSVNFTTFRTNLCIHLRM